MIIISSISIALVIFFIFAWMKHSNPLFALVAGAWAINCGYEVWSQYDCIGDCTFRMDQYFVYPFLGIFTLMGFAGLLKSKQQQYQKKITEDNSFKENA